MIYVWETSSVYKGQREVPRSAHRREDTLHEEWSSAWDVCGPFLNDKGQLREHILYAMNFPIPSEMVW